MEDFPEIAARSFYGKGRYHNLQSALEDLASKKIECEVDVVVIPPDVDTQTDEEEGDENYIHEDDITFPHDVAGEIELQCMQDNDADSDDDEDNIPLSVLQKQLRNATKKPEAKKRKPSEPIWTKTFVDTSMPATSGCTDRIEIVKHELEGLHPVEVFEKFFDNELYDYIVQQTNLYSSQKNNHEFFVSRDDMKLFFGILLLTGYHKLPSERNYWGLDEDLGVPIVARAMPRNRFQEIKRYVHLADNNQLDKSDKMAKVRPLIALLNQKFQQWGIFSEQLSIDESMVKFFGRHSSKQFIKGKPIRFGYKNWMLCSSTGYCFGYDTYCGAKPASINNQGSDLPLGSKVVLDLLKTVAVPSDHELFFDNYFTSHGLLKLLKDQGQRATGTVRDNRTRRCPLLDAKTFNKKDRGYFEHMYDNDSRLLFVRWKDNNTVTMATNYDSLEPIGRVKRWSAIAKARIDVPQPKIFSIYNQSMGGVDLYDQSVNNYRIAIRSKKWWWVLFTVQINMAVVNAWRLSQLACDRTLSLLEFQRAIVVHYLAIYQRAKTRPLANLPVTVRKQGSGHFPHKLDKQLRCCECHRRARWSCCLCRVTLCIERDCFKRYHS